MSINEINDLAKKFDSYDSAFLEVLGSLKVITDSMHALKKQQETTVNTLTTFQSKATSIQKNMQDLRNQIESQQTTMNEVLPTKIEAIEKTLEKTNQMCSRISDLFDGLNGAVNKLDSDKPDVEKITETLDQYEAGFTSLQDRLETLLKKVGKTESTIEAVGNEKELLGKILARLEILESRTTDLTDRLPDLENA